MECWSVGVLECWSVGVLECWSVGALERWSVGALERWSVDLPGKLDSPTLAGGVSARSFATNQPRSSPVTSGPLCDALSGRTLNADPQTLNALLDRAAMGRRHWN
jgi:hypothetical protein